MKIVVVETMQNMMTAMTNMEPEGPSMPHVVMDRPGSESDREVEGSAARSLRADGSGATDEGGGGGRGGDGAAEGGKGFPSSMLGGSLSGDVAWSTCRDAESMTDLIKVGSCR